MNFLLYMHKTSDINIAKNKALPSPRQLLKEIPKTAAQAALITQARKAINQILFGSDSRLLVIVGPCSIHNTDAALEYARRLASLQPRISEHIRIAMRVYFEKPRTSTGWKGLIMDPLLDGSQDIATGLRTARKILREVLDLGLPTATELLDPITPQYIADLVCWSAIGARTTESQIHRQMASGLSMPLGFKNTTDGSVQAAINAIKAATQPQSFLGINLDGAASIVSTTGNAHCHVVLRGSTRGPNYTSEHIREAESLLDKASLPHTLVIDCSHGNSDKQPERQPEVARMILKQILAGNRSIKGIMLESNLLPGKQPFPQSKGNLNPNLSITDACIGWETTEALLLEIHELLASCFGK